MVPAQMQVYQRGQGTVTIHGPSESRHWVLPMVDACRWRDLLAIVNTDSSAFGGS